jgi:AcrR family transcriptional regulator
MSSVRSMRDDRQLSARARATRGRVVRAARQCVLEQGPLHASSNEIARRAGVTWGVIQYHFGSREGILIAVVEDGFASLRRQLESVEIDTTDIGVRLRTIVDAVWDYHAQPEYLLYTDILRSLRRHHDSLASLEELLKRADDELAELWTRLLEPAMPAGGLSTRVVQRFIFATTRGLAVTSSLRSEEQSVSEERELLVRALTMLLQDQA